MATDIVGGLRILRGIGGEQTFGGNYAAQSQRVRESGVAAGRWLAAVESVGVLLSGSFVVAPDVARHPRGGRGPAHRRAARQLPRLRPLPHPADAHLRRVRPEVDPLGRLRPQGRGRALAAAAVGAPRRARSRCPTHAVIVDHASGRDASSPGASRWSSRPCPTTAAALADRLGRYLPSEEGALVSDEIPEELKGRAARRERSARARAREEQARLDDERARRPWGVTVGGVDLASVELDDVRAGILVSDTSPQVFAGTLREAVDPLGPPRPASRPSGPCTPPPPRTSSTPCRAAGRASSRSGAVGSPEASASGSSSCARSRPTPRCSCSSSPPRPSTPTPRPASPSGSAQHRAGRTTIVMTASPLLLHHADEVILLEGGVATARGRHADLLAELGGIPLRSSCVASRGRSGARARRRRQEAR